ncbi:HMGCS-1 [Symbiodinium natans]|uniref:HMGCS-1 protein n=1 Tax=Symbiodinium natans TaxID=878477 RepID=A0A812NYX8_9DINO|nr:HMGCS-1 [Symbiodinium natans]
MGPVVDGKYSIDAYMNCVDACYQTLKHKMNGRPLLQITDYNVFHTGGGYHVVKKAFERCIRAEDPKTKADVRERYVAEKLLPSVNLLKVIGPCHTVSSFLNISSVVMTKWDEALGKILLVFTYGSGCASSMYQLRFDDIAWFDPLAIWKVKQFYRNAIHVRPDLRMHQVYIDTWMKFDYRPNGRISFGFGYETYELDVYYLLEIDPWGRRFYHRGGMRTGPMNRKVMNANALNYDKVENRHTREHFGHLPPNGEAWEKQENKEEKAARSLEDKWREIEQEMTFEPEVDADGQPAVVTEKVAHGRKVVVREVGPPGEDEEEEEGEETTYQIVGGQPGK